MADTKYGHLFVTDPRDASSDFSDENEENTGLPNVGAGYALMGSKEFGESKVFVTTAFIRESPERALWVPEHKHEYDEIICWKGTDPDNPKDLGAELFMTIEGEEHIVTTTGSVYVPAGTNHCPLGWNWVRRPFIFNIIFLHGTYQTDEHERRRRDAAQRAGG
ncbi:MAG: hypothetical protein ACRDVP_10580 [Acidimicrobiales bacterium]